MAMSELYACLDMKQFPLQALLRLRPELEDKPVAVLDGEPPLEAVCACSCTAQTLGICIGMTRLELEMFPAARILHRSRSEEQAASIALLECAGSFSPRVEDQSDDQHFTCVIDIAGTERLFGSAMALGDRLRKKAQALRLSGSIAISSNFHAARCLARAGSNDKPLLVVQGGESAALAPLPISILNCSPQHAETFSMWGISRLGELAALGENDLIARLGQAGKEMRLLARGAAQHLFRPMEAQLALAESMELDSPVELLDSLLFVLGMMLDQLIVRAQEQILALASVRIELRLEGGASHTRTISPALPNVDKKVWLKLIHLDLQAHPPSAGILGLHVSAQTGSNSKVQMGLFSPQAPEPMRLDVTLARIRSIVGEGAVGQAVLKDTYRPDAFRMEPFTVVSATSREKKSRQAEGGLQRIAMRQLRPAEMVTVTVYDRRPQTFYFRDKRYSVERAYGPWSSAGEWWNPTLWSVEQWDLVARALDGSCICCCLTQDTAQDRWQVEALYD
jgi:protein ImuB